MPGGKKRTSLRLFVSILTGAILACFALIFFVIFHSTMPKMLLESETKYLVRQMALLEGLIASTQENVSLLTEDTAVWDETFRYAAGKHPDFIQTHWPDQNLLQNFRLSFIIVKNAAGEEMHTEFYDMHTKKSMPVSAEFSQYLAAASAKTLVQYSADPKAYVENKKFGTTGIILFDNTAYATAIMPILPVKGAPAPSGTMAMGVALNNAYLQNLTNDFTSTFSIKRAANPHSTEKNLIEFLDKDTVAIHTLFSALDGEPLRISMTEPREIYTEGVSLLNLTYGLLFVSMLIFGAVLYIAVLRLVIHPIEKLSNDISGISDANTAGSMRFVAEKYSKSSEFVVLCDSINSMLKKLGQSKISLSVLQRILNNIDANICVIDPEDNVILFMNDKMAEHYGIQGSAVGRTCWQTLQSGQTGRCDFCPHIQLQTQPDVPVVWEESNPITGRQYSNTGCLIEWADQKLVHLQLAVDITDIKEVEASLKKRLEQQELMSAMSRSFISSTDMADLIADALRMAGEFLNVSKILLAERDTETQTLTAKYEWYSKREGCLAPKETRLPFAPGTPEYEGFIVQKRPYLVYADISNLKGFSLAREHGVKSLAGVPVYVFGEFWGLLSFNECVTHRHWTESDIQLVTLIGSIISGVVERSITESQLTRMSSISDYSPQFISYVDPSGKFEYVNSGTMNALGYTADEVMEGGMSMLFAPDILENIHTDIIPRILEKGVLSFELPIINKAGETRIFSFSAFAITHKTVGIGAITVDITEQRRMEKEILAAKELAEKSNVAKSEFLSRMSHEMRTPLNAIIGMTSIAEAAEDLEKKQYCLEKIGDASKHLLGVINDILDMSKIEANKFELAYSEFTFEKMLMRVLNVVNFRIEEKEQTLVIRVDPDMPYSIVSDEQRLAQVIANLLSNAVKFTPSHGVITLSAEKVAEENGECSLLISVQDTGIGIPVEHQSKLFRSFEQADGGISRKFGGTGLGLAISKRIVEMMNGAIWVESEPGKGSAFSFTLKAKRGESTRQNALGEGAKWSDVRVLVADDAPDVREYFLALAESIGFSCVVAKDGVEAWEIFSQRSGDFNAIFIDWSMPRMDGIELAGKISASGMTHAVVIMISATEWSEIEKSARAAGVDKFIPKPLFSSSIVDCISECLGAASAVAEQEAELLPGSLSGHTILLAEDIDINREIVITLLEDTGIIIECAENGAEACSMFQSKPDAYSMIFMDIHMPEVDGYEATRQIRAMDSIARAKSIPIIAMTANVFREDIERCLAAGMNGHIGKPINLEEMYDKLREHCR